MLRKTHLTVPPDAPTQRMAESAQKDKGWAQPVEAALMGGYLSSWSLTRHG